MRVEEGGPDVPRSSADQIRSTTRIGISLQTQDGYAESLIPGANSE